MALPDDLIIADCGNCGKTIQMPAAVQRKKYRPFLSVAHEVKLLDRWWCEVCAADQIGSVGESGRTEGQRHGMKKTRS